MPFGAPVALTLPSLAAVLGLALVVLAAAVAAIRRAARGVELARLPLAPHHDLRLDAAGPVVLHGEGPRFARRFGGLTFRLVERTTGVRVPERRLWLRTSVAGWSRVRLALVRFDLERPGVYRLEVGGLVPVQDGDACAFVLTPATGVGLPLAIMTAIVAGASAIGALVGLGWLVVGTREAPDVVTIVAAPTPTAASPAPGAEADRPIAANARPTGAVAPAVALPTPAGARHGSGGRQLRGDPASVVLTHRVRWQKARLTLRVPPDFEVRASGEELDVRDPRVPSTYVVGHVVTFPPPTTPAMLAAVALESATERLQTEAVEGYAAVRFAGVEGVLTLESRADGGGRMAVWNAYLATPTGVRNVTVLFGAAAPAFARLEAVALAILSSARFD